MGRLSTTLILFFVVLSTPRWAAAQDLRAPQARQGYYVGAGFRSGVSTAEADAETIGSLGTLTHFNLWVRFGEKPLPQFGVGLAIGGGVESNDVWSVGSGGLLLDLQFEPFKDLDLAVRGSIGVGGGGISRVNEADEREDDPSFMFGPIGVLGISYDWFPFYDASSYASGGFGLTFFVEGRYFPGGDLTTGGGFAGIELFWWTGLPKRKLELPLEKAF